MAHVKDLTHGKPWKLILMFALPLMAGNVCQQLYILVDTFVVGKYVGVEALAALGAADWLNWFILGIPTGFAQGFSILMSQNFGAGDREELKRTIAMSIELSAAIAVITLIASQASLQSTLDILKTPANVMRGSLIYLRIYFAGIPLSMAYNLLSGMLRALGDSRTPLIAMVAASLINVLLDFCFTLALGWGIAGVSIATVIAQGAAMLYCLAASLRLREARLERAHFTPSGRILKKLMQLGAPIALQNTIISLGGLCMQYVVNGFGFHFLAGFTATNKLYGLLEMAAISYGYAISTYTGQNMGARRYTRIKQGVRAAVKMSLATSITIALSMLLCGKGILIQFISGSAEEVAEVLDVAYTYLAFMAVCLPLLYLLYVYRSAQQGMGDTLIPMASGVVELIIRVCGVFTLPLIIAENGIYLSEVGAWTGAALMLMLSYYIKQKKFPADTAGGED